MGLGERRTAEIGALDHCAKHSDSGYAYSLLLFLYANESSLEDQSETTAILHPSQAYPKLVLRRWIMKASRCKSKSYLPVKSYRLSSDQHIQCNGR